MSLVRFQQVSKSYEGRPVLREVFFKLSEGERVGLIGKNGSGKTTALKLILGHEVPTAGAVEIEQGTRIGYFSQFSELSGTCSINDELELLFADVHALEAALAAVDGTLATDLEGAALDEAVSRQAALLEQMEARGGWSYTHRIDTVLTRLGFDQAHRERPIDQLSGGWRNRAALAKLLLDRWNVLLLDEPTNFLDVAGLQWLEDWMQRLPGALIVVSHDRNFLDNVVTRIVEVEHYKFQEYPGNFTDYIREKRLRVRSLERQFQHEEKLLAFEAEAIADRREAAKDPSGALKRRLAGIKKRTEPRPVDRVITSIYEGLKPSERLCQVDNLSKRYDDQTLFSHLFFEVHRGERLAVIGPNGCGKTTLLRVMTGAEKADTGEVVWARGGDFISYNERLDALDLDDTVTHAVNIFGLGFHAARKKVHQFLALLQFTEADLKQRIRTLSGGQRARVALAQCLLSGASVIVLDEPTNHLDLTSTQVMERALLHFPGGVIVVSHDRFFVDKVATRLLVFEGDGRIDDVHGNWTIWQASRGPSGVG